jgi:hypothetical protein
VTGEATVGKRRVARRFGAECAKGIETGAGTAHHVAIVACLRTDAAQMVIYGRVSRVIRSLLSRSITSIVW